MSRVLPPSAAGKPMAVSTLPRFRWPSKQHEIPTRCTYDVCGGALMVTIPTADDPIADVTCINCARTAAELIADGTREPMTPAAFKALPHNQGRRGPADRTPSLRPCQACGERLARSPWARYCQPCADEINRVGSADAMRASRERRRVGLAPWSRDHDACTGCGLTEAEHKARGLCYRCYARSDETRQA